MMRTDDQYRGTLHIPEMIEEYGLQAAIAVNNVGNAFTPQGNCDPLSVASLGVGLYSRGTLSDMDLLFVCDLWSHTWFELTRRRSVSPRGQSSQSAVPAPLWT